MLVECADKGSRCWGLHLPITFREPCRVINRISRAAVHLSCIAVGEPLLLQFPDPSRKRRARILADCQNRASAEERRQHKTGRGLNHPAAHRMIGPPDQPAHFLFKLGGKPVFRQLRRETAPLLTGRIQYDPAGQAVQRLIGQSDPPFLNAQDSHSRLSYTRVSKATSLAGSAAALISARASRYACK